MNSLSPIRCEKECFLLPSLLGAPVKSVKEKERNREEMARRRERGGGEETRREDLPSSIDHHHTDLAYLELYQRFD